MYFKYPCVSSVNCIATRTFRDNKVTTTKPILSFDLILISTLTWITEEELEREIKKTKETNFVGRITSKFYSDGEKCEILAELAATKVKMSGSEKRKNRNMTFPP